MKKSLVLKALSMMDDERVTEFLDNDCRSIDEIVDAVADEWEKKYIYFMVDLFRIAEKLEEEKTDKETSDDILIPVKNSIFTDEQMKKIRETMSSTFPWNINIPELDTTKYVAKYRERE
jgi:6-phosphogluconate dehydrogenase (decarboxylating)